jgi:hypothetical protein
MFARRGLDLVAIEPDPQMAAIARAACAPYPQARIVSATFEEWVADGTFGLLFSAQSWHWVASGIRYRKAHHLVGPAGCVSLFWSRPCWAEFTVDLAGVYEVHAPELYGIAPWFPGFRYADTVDTVDTVDTPAAFTPKTWLPEGTATEIDASGYFRTVGERSYRWSTECTPAGLVDLLKTLPEHDAFPAPRRQSLFAHVYEAATQQSRMLSLGYESRLYIATALAV